MSLIVHNKGYLYFDVNEKSKLLKVIEKGRTSASVVFKRSTTMKKCLWKIGNKGIAVKKARTVAE